jgi:hypothetical protein
MAIAPRGCKMAALSAGSGVTSTLGRISVQSRHLTDALPDDDRVAVEMLETHLYLRDQGPNAAVEVIPRGGGVGVFLTTRRVQKVLRLIGSHKTGKDYARSITREILPRLGLLEDTGLTKKPGPEGRGGRHFQPRGPDSYWWILYRLPALSRLRVGAYPARSGHPQGKTPWHTAVASLWRLVDRQGLIGGRPTR